MGKQVGILVFSDLLVCALAAPLIAQPAQAGFGFSAPDIRGFPTGAVRLTGGTRMTSPRSLSTPRAASAAWRMCGRAR